MARLIIALLCFLAIGSLPSWAQNVRDVCRTYAQDAVSFQQQNLELGCSLAGPEWNADFNYHFNWCVNGNNYRSAGQWTDFRRSKIAQCRETAGQQAPPQPTKDVAAACERYASEAIAQQNTNRQLSCGFSGPEWNDDYRYHYNWCINERNWQTATAGSTFRETHLAACRTAHATPETPSSPQKPGKAVSDAWSKRIPTLMKDILAQVDLRIERAKARAQKKRGTFLKYNPLDIGALMAASKKLSVADRQKAFDQSVQSELRTALVEPKVLHLPPEIDSIITAPLSNRIEPGTSLLIIGKNFGDKPGRVYLTYETRRETPSTESRKEAVVTEVIELEPFRGTWQNSWFSNVILVSARVVYKDPFLVADRPGEVRVVLPDGSAAAWSLTVGSGAPVIDSIETASGHNWIKPGDEFVIKGRNFGSEEQKGTVSLYSGEAGPRVLRRVKGANQYVYWPADESVERPVPPTIAITVPKGGWSNTLIVARAGQYPSNTYYSGGPASITLENWRGHRGIRNDLFFGPENTIKVVSGFSWIGKPVRESKSTVKSDNAMIVSHVPDCGTFSQSGERGYDSFFSEMPWPKDVAIIGFNFVEIDPEDPYTELDFFGDQAGELIDAAMSPWGFAKFIAGKIFDAIFSGGGGYHAYVAWGPDQLYWVHGKDPIAIGWETSCNLDGKPIMYLVSFTIAGTKKAVAKY